MTTQQQKVEFYFDLGSPFSYLAFYKLQEITKKYNAVIDYTPILLGGIFKSTGNKSPIEVPVKGIYSMQDLSRWSDYYQIPMQMNPYFPMNTLTLMRILTGVKIYHDEYFEVILTKLFDAMFRKPLNLADPEVLINLFQGDAIDGQQLLDLSQDPVVKQKLSDETNNAVQRGVFGAPTFFLRENMYWGQDRLHFVERELQK
ncbi:2-hydroxychromene-2-carboxylate isomerase [Acinetobacter sp. DSM 11652]|uniref:2-hydroxychromene-2-carboxylate isomerase n=1 Tax=Acinetobacter sp. DSM 11652 TaxID=346222 RepID=UPI0008C70330|nr:2-hydroxychromene-2-carboxylate isomerase [Acinetobacter sp. DSM 11652]SEL45793.1 2-hydroxychromene-2-carboxylate isomerase [Acinetobacter sp. DSM 11652]